MHYDLTSVLPIVREAAAYAKAHAASPEYEWKADHTMVTEVDRGVERLLRGRLQELFPDDVVAGEELRGFDAKAERIWVIDPIDGTACFVSGVPTWSISVGLLDHGCPAAGIIVAPMTDDWYVTTGPGDVRWNDRPVAVDNSPTAHSESCLLLPSTSHLLFEVDFAGKTRNLGSAAMHLALVARGAAVASISNGVGIWDMAAGAAMVVNAGGTIGYLHDLEIDWTTLLDGRIAPAPILAAAPGFAEQIRRCVRFRETTATYATAVGR